MPFLGVNVVAVAVAGLAAFVFGGIWYGVLSKQWLAASRLPAGEPRSQTVPLAVTLVAEMVMALFVAGLMGHFVPEAMTLKAGVLSGLAIWIGYILPTVVVAHQFQAAKVQLTLIDGLHWLGVFVILGGVIGWFGPPSP